ncbi:MAG: nucleotide exchange factor GrpE [Deltaproteobacteria bacterium]|nr:MAG: nucleotide exchange factor GrpE [Deltaproteobacteria bacterium]
MVDGKDDRDATHRPGEGEAEARADDPPAPSDAALAAAQDEARQNHDRWLRAAADLENFKKRMARERTEAVRFANESFIRDLLPIVDNLERALEHARQGGNGKSIVEGLELVLKALVDVLERHGITKVEAAGVPFDPTHHEAVAHVETGDVEPNRVLEQHQPGYLLNERLLRPALVSVSKAPAADAKLAKDKARG